MRAALWVGLATLVCSRGWAYAPPIHALVPQRALSGHARLAPAILTSPSPGDLDAFRTWLDAAFRTHPDKAVAAQYVALFPSPEDFDAAALKRLLQLNGAVPIEGLDVFGPTGLDALGLMSVGSVQPDQDGRNRGRLARDASGAPMTLPDGRKVPADPIILNMGDVEGLSSQAHAHYGLLPDLSGDVEVLKREPRRFAVAAGWPAGPVMTLGPQMAQSHYDLAVLAQLWGGAGAPALSHLLLGQSLHYVADLCNQIHTVQVGYQGFFVQAKLLTLKRSLVTLGGYLGELRPFTSVGLDMLVSHHTWSESLMDKRVEEAQAGKPVAESVQAMLGALTQDDGEFKKDIEMAVAQGITRAGKQPYVPVALLVAQRLIDFSSREGGDLYRHAAGAAQPRMQQPGLVFDKNKDDPDAFVGDLSRPEVKAHLDSLYWLQAKGMARAGSATRMLFSRYEADAGGDPEPRAARAQAFAAAFLSVHLQAMTEQRARLDGFLANPPPAPRRTYRDPVWLVGPPGALLAAVLAGVAWRRRRKPAEPEIASYPSG